MELGLKGECALVTGEVPQGLATEQPLDQCVAFHPVVRGDVAEDRGERPDQFRPGNIPGNLHAAMTSSRTKCSRISFGVLPSSKWQRAASRALVQLRQGIGLGEDRVADRAGDVPALGRFLDDEHDLAHGRA